MDSDMNNGNDDADKWPFKKKSKNKPASNLIASSSPEADSCSIVPELSGNVDSDEYSIKFPLGKCLIFNHQVFYKEPERKGTDMDAKRLYSRFRKMGFEDVKRHNDLTVREVMEKLENAAKEEYPKSSCFICCILTHGNNGWLCAKDGMYPIHSLYDIFNGNVCSSLRGKPKIFFIQACQGAKADSGVPVTYKKESLDSSLKIPIYADFLIMLSSFPGFVSFKNENMGSYFIKYLCEVLSEHSENKHLMDMLIIVTRKIAFYFESYNNDASKDQKKQIPYITSTLTKNVKFPLRSP